MEWNSNNLKKEADYLDLLPDSLKNEKKLTDFFPLLFAIEEKYNEVKALSKLNVLELGPGKRTELGEFLSAQAETGKYLAVGLPEYKKLNLEEYIFQDINDYLLRLNGRKIDLVINRFVLEENSFHPGALFLSKAFRKMLIKGRKKEILEELPGSREYILKTYKLLGRRLKKGGIIASLVVDRKRAEIFLDSTVMEEFNILRQDQIGPRMGLFVLEKK